MKAAIGGGEGRHHLVHVGEALHVFLLLLVGHVEDVIVDDPHILHDVGLVEDDVGEDAGVCHELILPHVAPLAELPPE